MRVKSENCELQINLIVEAKNGALFKGFLAKSQEMAIFLGGEILEKHSFIFFRDIFLLFKDFYGIFLIR